MHFQLVQEYASKHGYESFEEIFEIPMLDSSVIIANVCPREIWLMKKPVTNTNNDHENQGGAITVEWNGTSEQIVRRCRSDPKTRTQFSGISSEGCNCKGKKLNDWDWSNRALHNFHVGLAIHSESNKDRRDECPSSSSDDLTAKCCSASHANRASQDAVWDLLLQ
jgi:hypothetical protein